MLTVFLVVVGSAPTRFALVLDTRKNGTTSFGPARSGVVIVSSAVCDGAYRHLWFVAAWRFLLNGVCACVFTRLGGLGVYIWWECYGVLNSARSGVRACSTWSKQFSFMLLLHYNNKSCIYQA